MSTAKQMFHVFRKDLRRFWPWLGLLVVLMWLWVAEDLFAGTGFGGVRVLGVSIVPALLVLFSGLVVQEDPTAGDGGFWITRPVEPVAVWGAKLTFLGLFLVVLPVAVQTLAVADIPSREPTAAILGPALVIHGGVIFMAAVVAAVTSGLRSFVVAILTLTTGVALVTQGLLPRLAAENGEGLALTIRFLTRGAWLTLGIALLGHQILTRRSARTWVIGIGAVTGIGLLSPRLGLDLSRSTHEPAERVALDEDVGARLMVDRVELEVAGVNSRLEPEASGLAVTWHLRSETDYYLQPASAVLELLGPEPRRDIDARADPFGGSFEGDLESLEGLTRLGRGATGFSKMGRTHGLSGPEQEVVERVQRADGLRVTISVDAYRPVIGSFLPLEEGAEWRTEHRNLTIVRASRGDRFVGVEVHSEAVASPLTRQVELYRPDVGFLLVNRPRGQFVTSTGGGGSGGAQPFALGGVRIASVSRELNYQPDRSGEPAEFDGSWFDEAELGIVELEYVGSFDVSATIDGTYLPTAPGEETRLPRTGLTNPQSPTASSR